MGFINIVQKWLNRKVKQYVHPIIVTPTQTFLNAGKRFLLEGNIGGRSSPVSYIFNAFEDLNLKEKISNYIRDLIIDFNDITVEEV